MLDRLSAAKFQKGEPYPYFHIDRTLTPEGYERLRETLPSLENFDRHEGMKRGHGQMPHNRFMLHYKAGLELPGPWREFLDELRGRLLPAVFATSVGAAHINPHFFVALRFGEMFGT